MIQDNRPAYYFRAIDGLRLIASINIVLFHLEGIGGLADLQGAPAWLFRTIKGPAVHASAFFVLGGFIFTLKYGARSEFLSTRRFFLGRFRDLYPLHVLTTVAMILLVLVRSPVVDIPKLVISALLHLSFLWSLFPLHTYTLNTPSWALSAFFFCYLLFGPALRLIVRIRQRRHLILLMTGCIVPPLAWSLVYASMGMDPRYYAFFHMFAPIRFFEFLMGIFLARLFQINDTKPRTIIVRDVPFLNDLLILGAAGLIYLNLRMGSMTGPLGKWISYHVAMTPLYTLLLYRLARENGCITKMLKTPVVRQIGQSSFYPYLVHIPLISWITFILERWWGYRGFLHSSVNVLFFMAVLYAGSWAFFQKVRKPRRQRRSAQRPLPAYEAVA